MGFKQRVGNFFLLAGAIGLVVFVATLLAPGDGYNLTITAFLVGALLFGLGLKFRMSKQSGPPREADFAEPHSAPKSGSPQAGAKKQGLVNTIVKGPADRKKTAPAPPKPPSGGAGGGHPPTGKGGAGDRGQGK